MAKSKAHPGFANVAAGMAQKQGIPLANAQAELASSSRGASAAAKKKNPRLNRVKGKKKRKGGQDPNYGVFSKGGGY